MKKLTENSKPKKNKENELSKFVKDVKKGTYTEKKVDSNMRVSVYTTNYNGPSYTFGVR